MSCTRHVLALRWNWHAWDRRVTHTESRSLPGTDQWGRVVPSEHVICHTEYVCRTCGAVRDGGDCSCEPERAERCAVRLAWLAKIRAPEHGTQPPPDVTP